MDLKTSRATSAVVIFLALFHPLLALAQQTQQPTAQQPGWNWPGPWHMWQGGWGFWWVFPLLMFLMMIVCVVGFLRGHRSGGGRLHCGAWHEMDRPSRALEVLNERYAKGEIQQQEYEEKQAAILSRGQP